MKIIKMLRKRGHIYEVRFDDGTYINLDIDLAHLKNICEGMLISDAQAFELEDESELIRCKNRALYILGQRDISEKKLREKLLKAGFEERFIIDTLKRMKELCYIDDKSYGEKLKNSCYESGLSARASVSKLISSGIDTSSAKELCFYDSSIEQKKITRVINKSYKNKLDTPENVQKTAAALARKGFLFSDIRAVLKDYDRRLNGEYTDE